MLNAHRDEIAVVENATRAWDMAFYAFAFRPGDRILTGRAEYSSNWIALRQVARKTGAIVEMIDDDEHGQIDLAELERRLDASVKLVSLVHVPTDVGLVNPAKEVGALARAAGVPLLLDACQSAGQLPLDVEELGCDVLSGTGRKFLRGPRGTGFLYVRRGLLEELEPPLLDLHAAELEPDGSYTIRPDARRFENWEFAYALVLGLSEAAKYAIEVGVERGGARARGLAALLRERLSAVPGCRVLDRGRELAALVTVEVAGEDAQTIVARLREQKINTNATRREYAVIDMDAKGASTALRLSPHYYNTEDEIEVAVAAVADACRSVRL